MFGLKTKIAGALTAAAVVGAGFVVPAQAQNYYQQQVNALFRNIAQIASSNGFTSSHTRHNGQLRAGQTENVSINLSAGVSYMMVAACDEDCTDIDLWIYDENGNLIDEDIEYDDTPIVTVTPRRTATFTLRARMVTCNVQPCYYGIGAYAR